MQAASWNLGWITLAALWLGPLPDWAIDSFAAHMTLHMGVVAVAAPLLSIGMAGRRYDPVRYAPALFAAVVASVGELLVVWAWHTPVLHRWARYDAGGFVAEQGSFLLAGLWVWLSAYGGAPRGQGRSASGVFGLLLTSMHMTFLGALLALSPRVLFAHPSGGGLTPLEDQHLGGAIMLVVGGASYLVGGLWLMQDLVKPVRAGEE